MSYVALYRKFRPSDFEDVKGQDHIVTTLKNEVKSDRIGHAYLFCGTRGTGKTTVAKILAKAVNCENPKDGSPCNECPSCKAINAQHSLNVSEIDAASNNGVSNVRDIIEEVQYAPTEGRFRVYIIDEVHMLSNGAFNALLKTLEEPPPYIIFILATTEAHKIPITILSRCQRYDFKRISIDTISDRLTELTKKEGVDLEKGASDYIAKVADGSMRDALSLLDQCIAFYPDSSLTMDKVLNVLGAVDSAMYEKLFKCLTSYDYSGCISLLDDIQNYGRDLQQFINEFIWHIRNVMITGAIAGEGARKLLNVSDEVYEELTRECKMATQEELIRYIRVLSELSSQLKYSTQKRVITDICFIKLTNPQMDAEEGIDNLSVRLEAVEKKLDNPELFKGGEKEIVYVNAPATEETKPLTETQKKEYLAALPEDIQNILKRWNEVCKAAGVVASSYLSDIKPMEEDGKLKLGFTQNMGYRYYTGEDGKHREELEKILSELSGKAVEVVIADYSDDEGDMRIPDLSEIIDFDIEFR